MQHELFVAQKAENPSHKPDTILGICEAVGTDLGFNPNFLRVAFLPLLFFAPKVMIGAYLGLGLVVLASRLVFPKPRRPLRAAKVERKPELVAA